MTRLAEDWGIYLLSPILQGPCISDSVLQLAEADVLGTKPHVLCQQEMVLANQGVHWQLCVVIFHFLCPVEQLRYLKGGMYLLGKFSVFCMARDLCQLLPPRCHLNIPSMLLSNQRHVRGRALDLQEVVVVRVVMVSAVVGGHLPHQHLLGWALPHPGVAGDVAQVAGGTQGPHLPL